MVKAGLEEVVLRTLPELYNVLEKELPVIECII